VRAPFIDHLTLRVRDVEASRRFYEQALAPWAIRVVQSSQGLDPDGNNVEAVVHEGR
jgi:extradiol dioxygenase family protein